MAGSPPLSWMGKYEVLEPLAVGGMAQLFLARTTGPHEFEKIVVLKRIMPRLAADPAIVKLFLNEARLAATLQHPNIVQVYDVGSEEGDYFFAMEHVDGVDLRSLVSRAREAGRAIPLDAALSIVIGLCAGLHYAHERTDLAGRPLNIIHCDVSPSNVLVAFDGSVKMTDFGIAKALGAAADARQTTVRGKHGYMSPEQCLCQPLDRRTDIFSVAVLLAELTSGRRLFAGQSDFETLKQVVEQRPRYRAPRGRRALEAVVLKALARDRDARYRTALELQLELESLARRWLLAISPTTVARLMAELFGERPARWPGPDQVTASVGPSPGGDELREARPPASPRRTLGVVLATVVLGLAALTAGLGLLLSRRGPGLAPAPAPARPRAATVPPAGQPTRHGAAAAAAAARDAGEPAPAAAARSPRPAVSRARPLPHKRRAAAGKRRSTATRRAWDPEAAAPPRR